MPIDFTNSGQKTTEHLDKLPFGGKEGFSIEWRLKKATPVMDFDYFLMTDKVDKISMEKEIVWGWGKIRRIVEYVEGNPLEIRSYGGEEGISNDPKRFLYQFEVKSLEYFPDKRTIRLVAQQELFDFTSQEFVETEITYLFKYGGPVN